jgi:hypothetical protein
MDLFLALPDFLAEGKDGYGMFVGEEVLVGSSGEDQFSLVEGRVKRDGVIAPEVEGRIAERG